MRDIPVDACVVAYNMSFECAVIKGLADAFPDLSDHLLAVRDRFVDLIVPFRSGSCYAAAQNGSFSIKAVLPALFPRRSRSRLSVARRRLQRRAGVCDVHRACSYGV